MRENVCARRLIGDRVGGLFCLFSKFQGTCIVTDVRAQQRHSFARSRYEQRNLSHTCQSECLVLKGNSRSHSTQQVEGDRRLIKEGPRLFWFRRPSLCSL